MTYNHSEIMTEAHTVARACIGHAMYAGCTYARIFAGQLRRIWAQAKLAAAVVVPKTEVEQIYDAIKMLENKDRWTQADYAQRDKLGVELRKAQAHEAAAPEYAEKRTLIEASCGRYCAVTFTKKDGTPRTMRVQPAKLKFHLKGNAASEPAQRAVETRKARHPHLLPVWDAEASAPRSVNLATISRIAVNGAVHEYRTH